MSHPTCENREVQPNWSTGRLLGFDLETTGIDRFDDVPVSFAFVPYDHGGPDGPAVTSFVNPGRPIPPEAAAIHGISNERVRAEGISLFDAAVEIVSRLLEASADGVPVVGANLVYDLTMVEALARRELGVGLLEQGFSAPVIDVLVIDKTFAKWRKGQRKLEVLAGLYDVELTGAHDAVADATASVEVAIAQASRYSTSAGRDQAAKWVKDLDLSALDPRALHELQVDWHHRWAVDFSDYLVRNGKKAFTPDEYQWPVATPEDLVDGGVSGYRDRD